MPNVPLSHNRELARSAVRMVPDGGMIQVTPTEVARQVADLPEERIPRIGVNDWLPAGEGTYRPVARIHGCWLRVTDAERVTGLPYLALRRLILAGFCEGAQPSPKNVLIDIHSYFRHLEKTKAPDFWTPERRRRFNEALSVS